MTMVCVARRKIELTSTAERAFASPRSACTSGKILGSVKLLGLARNRRSSFACSTPSKLSGESKKSESFLNSIVDSRKSWRALQRRYQPHSRNWFDAAIPAQ